MSLLSHSGLLLFLGLYTHGLHNGLHCGHDGPHVGMLLVRCWHLLPFSSGSSDGQLCGPSASIEHTLWWSRGVLSDPRIVSVAKMCCYIWWLCCDLKGVFHSVVVTVIFM